MKVLNRLSCRPPRGVFDFKKRFKKEPFSYDQDIGMAFSPPVVGCLIKKGLQKGGLRAPQNSSGYALEYHPSNIMPEKLLSAVVVVQVDIRELDEGYFSGSSKHRYTCTWC